MRERYESDVSENPFRWIELNSFEIFRNRRVVIVGVPGAFTPACSDSHLPGYEAAYNQFFRLGVDDIYCIAVNDAFVMYQWAKSLGLERVKMLPDGNGEFTYRFGMLVGRKKHGMGLRSWRYSAFVNNGVVERVFAEANLRDDPDAIPVEASAATEMLSYLETLKLEQY